ncbi:3'-5' exonuclease [Mesorhizobium sp. ArgA1]
MGIENETFFVMDVEGSGATPPEIVELAITSVNDLKIGARRWEWRVQPNGPIAAAATRIHGITQDDVAKAPSIDDIAGEIMTWTDGQRIIGHNVRVELEIISRSIPDWKPSMAIDTLRLAKAIRPGLTSYGLENLSQALNISEEAERLTGGRHHSAAFDTVVTALLFIELISSLPANSRMTALMGADILNNRQGVLL